MSGATSGGTGSNETVSSETTLPIASARSAFRAVRRLARVRRGALTATVVLLFAGSGAALVTPRALGWLVDAVLAGASTSRLVHIVVTMLAAGVIGAALVWWGGRLLVACLQGIVADLREEVFDVAIDLEVADVENAGSSDVVSRVTRDVEAISEAVSGVLPVFVQATFTIALTAVGLAAIDPWLALAALAAVPVQVIATRWFIRRSRPLYTRLRQEESRRGQAIIETAAGAETVKAHRVESQRLELVATRSLTAVETQHEAGRARNWFSSGVNGAEFVGLAAVLVVGFWLSGPSGLTVGAVTAAALYFHRVFNPVSAVLSSVDELQRASVGLERLVGVVEAARKPRAREQIADAAVRVEGLRFAYDHGRDVLHDVSLQIPSGSTVAFVGASGSGKSTLARLIAGVLPVTRGEVTIGGVPPSSAGDRGGAAALLVTQETHLFRGTIADNLRLAAPTATQEALTSALQVVGADWAIESGLEAEPVMLDEGKIQQLALARAVLVDPAVLILDEATANAGSGPAAETLRAAATAVSRGRTSIVVAHHLAEAVTADLVVTFERGFIVEAGTYAELVDAGGPFSELWEAWNSVAR